MNYELSLYRTWKKLSKKINKDEEEVLKEICCENKNIINVLKSLSMKINIRKNVKRKNDRRDL